MSSDSLSQPLSDSSDSDDVGEDSDYEAEEDGQAAVRARRPRCGPRAPSAAAAAAEEDTPPAADARLQRGAPEDSSDAEEASPSVQEPLSAYELERAARIEANKKRLAELVQLPAALGAGAGAPKPKAQKRQRLPLSELQQAASRGSARLRGEKAPLAELDEHDRVLDPSTVATTESGELVAYSACHCCRQTTSKLKAVCTTPGCPLQWCVNCLANKEGVDAAAANESGTWRCPLCVGGVGGCLCSMCRRKAGRPALGPLWPLAQKQGFTSVRAFITATGMA